MARAADVHLEIDDFQRIADRTPYLADLKYVPLHSPAPIMSYLASAGPLAST